MVESDLIVIIPTRGRPDNAVALEQAFVDTNTTAKRVYVVDFSDELRKE